jgi:hypothetical protein
MAFIDPTTQIIQLDTRARAPSVYVKDTVTVEDIVFMYARTSAVNKLGTKNIVPQVPANIRHQITRVPYVR